MKLQHLTIIFIIIVLPLILILSAYTSSRIDTLTLQNQYDVKLMDATYDGIKAFEINTSYNDLVNVADLQKEDVEAAISAFMNSLAMNMGFGGYNQGQLRSFIPAILFTLYDGYYIYSPIRVNGNYEYILKPYNYYTVRYKKDSQNDVIINYTLDNYITVYGWIDGNYIVKSGYLINDKKDVKEENELFINVPIANVSNNEVNSIDERDITNIEYNDKEYLSSLAEGETDTRTEYLYPRNDAFYIDPKSAQNYYDEAYDFTEWAKKTTTGLGWIKTNMAVRNGEYLKDKGLEEFGDDKSKSIFSFNNKDNDPEDSTSIFSQHKTDVIKYSIQDNLNQAITAYSQGSTTSYDFKLPKLDINEWETIATNVCMLTFMQGVPCGTKYYNNYSLVVSTTNKLYTTKNNLYFIADGDDYYHKIDCKKLSETANLIGYPSIDFEPKRVKIGNDKYTFYYRHVVDGMWAKKACYYCIVNSNYKETDIEGLDATKKKAYYTALARTKYIQYKSTADLNYDEDKDKDG